MTVDPRLILKTHAACLVVLTVALTVAGNVGLETGTGPFAWLGDHPVALPGLMQAYLLMLLVAVGMWLGADGRGAWRWSVVAIGAHAVPLVTLWTLWDVLAGTGAPATVGLSYAIHGLGIAAEVVGLVATARSRRPVAPGSTPPQPGMA